MKQYGIDKRDVLNAVDIHSVIDLLGIKTVRRGRELAIRCPSHVKMLGKPDQNIGNCVIKGDRYHCYACGASGDVISLFADATNCSFKEAVEKLGKIYGVADVSIDPNCQIDHVLSTRDLEIIGLHPKTFYEMDTSERLIYNSTRERVSPSDRENCYRCNSEFIFFKKKPRISLLDLYERDRKLYYAIISSKATEAVKRYEGKLNQFADPKSPKAQDFLAALNVEPSVAEEIMSGVIQELSIRKSRAEEIAEEYFLLLNNKS